MTSQKATGIVLFDFRTPQMRAFHMTWFAFFLCFFAWFGIAPLMPTIRTEMDLQPWQVGNLIIASVAMTIVARLLIGWLCDRYGPRLTYTWLLLIGSLPVMGVGLATSYESLFWFRMAIGAIGASFVITQYHTTMMFAPNCVGTANAVTAGWGNLGGGVTQQVMPLLASAMVYFTSSAYLGWRLSMVVAGAVCCATGVAYWFLTQDTPEGNFEALRASGRLPPRKYQAGAFVEACRDRRVWALAVAYAACFGIELTINNVAATYFHDRFEVNALVAGVIAGMFGLVNVFGRALGGWLGDRCGQRWGLSGRVRWLFAALFCEGIALILFSQVVGLTTAIASMLVFSLFVQMSCGATFSVVPFVNQRALGSVAGIVGAGGNAGAVAAGFLFKSSTDWWPTALLALGIAVTISSFVVLWMRTSAAMPLLQDDRIDVPDAAPSYAMASASLSNTPAL